MANIVTSLLAMLTSLLLSLVTICLHFPNVPCLPTWYQVLFLFLAGRGAVPGTVHLHTLGSTSQQEPCNTNVPSGLVPRTLLWTYFWAFLGRQAEGPGWHLVRYLCETRKTLHERPESCSIVNWSTDTPYGKCYRINDFTTFPIMITRFSHDFLVTNNPPKHSTEMPAVALLELRLWGPALQSIVP